MKQKVINNPGIYKVIEDALFEAQKEVLVSTAWFTDKDLLDLLIQKANNGVSVSLIVSDNELENSFDFGALRATGAQVQITEKTGIGMMHQKFCVIDGKVAIHGSYNWTYNARKNNAESVIYTTHKQTVKELKETHMKMMNSIKKDEESNVIDLVPEALDGKGMMNNNSKEPDQAKIKLEGSDFAELLEQLIESEIYKFNKDELIEHGFQQANHTNGDAQTLPNLLDNLYSDFINSLDIAEEKKESLLLKVNELKNKRLNRLKLEQDDEYSRLLKESKVAIDALNLQKDNIANEIEQFKLEQEKIREKDIAIIEDLNSEHNNELDRLALDLTQSKVKWYELIPSLVLFVGLLAYVFVFYSSAAYILIFGNKDAELAKKMGLDIIPPEVFEPNAFAKASSNHGGLAIMFILLFVFVPITISLMKSFLKSSKWYVELGIYSLIVLIDGIIAYQVTKSIHEVNYLSGLVDHHFSLDLLFISADFYLVFVMGALGLFGLKLMYDKIYRVFESVDADAMSKKLRLQCKQIGAKINKNEAKKKELMASIKDLDKAILDKETVMKGVVDEISTLSALYSNKEESIKTRFATLISEVEDIAELHLQKIQNNNLRFSVHALKDRVNTFLNGWINFLHDMYANPRAIAMTATANELKDSWLDGKQSNLKVA